MRWRLWGALGKRAWARADLARRQRGFALDGNFKAFIWVSSFGLLLGVLPNVLSDLYPGLLVAMEGPSARPSAAAYAISMPMGSALCWMLRLVCLGLCCLGLWRLRAFCSGDAGRRVSDARMDAIAAKLRALDARVEAQRIAPGKGAWKSPERRKPPRL